MRQRLRRRWRRQYRLQSPAGETADPGCSSANDNQEEDGQTEPTPACSNGDDDDGDGKTDFTPPSGGTADPGCGSASDLDEGSEGLPPGEDSNPAAVSDSTLTGFPTNGATFAILSSGNSTFADDANDSSSTGQSNGNGAGTETHGGSVNDLITLRVNVNVPSNANCLRVDFRYASDEFPEYVGSQFNDGFLAELDGSDFTIDSSDPSNPNPITAPRNFAFDQAGKVISINTTGFSAAEAAGTTYDGATPRLQASTPITPGAHSIFLSVFDQGDSAFDSAAFIDNMTLTSVPAASCAQGATPPPDSCDDPGAIVGTDSPETLTGTPGPDVICGAGGNDTISGEGGNDRLFGGEGNDRLRGGSGGDLLDGQSGLDRALYDDHDGGVSVDIDDTADDGNATEDGAQDNVTTSVESVTGSPLNDTITGSCANNTLAPVGGDDTVSGDPTAGCSPFGNDFMGGANGGGTFNGNDTFHGGARTDTVTYTKNTASQGVGVTLNNAADDGDGIGATDDVRSDIETVYGGAGSDTIDARGAPRGVSLFGRGGDDTMFGSPFNDLLAGEAGSDTLDCGGGLFDQQREGETVSNCEISSP